VRQVPLRWAYVRHRLHHVIFRLKIAAETRREIADTPVTLDQLLTTPAGNALGTDFVMAARCLGHECVGRLQNGSAFLLQLFPARLDHLVVRRLLKTVRHQLLSEIFFVLDPRRAVPGG